MYICIHVYICVYVSRDLEKFMYYLGLFGFFVFALVKLLIINLIKYAFFILLFNKKCINYIIFIWFLKILLFILKIVYLLFIILKV